MASRRSSRTVLILPLVLLSVVVLEEIVVYELRKHVANPHLRTAAILAFFGIALSLATTRISPWLSSLFVRARRSSKNEAGVTGVWLFYGVAYGLLYYAFFVMETRGVVGLLPQALR